MDCYRDWLDAQRDTDTELAAASDEALTDRLQCMKVLENVPWFRAPPHTESVTPFDENGDWPQLESSCAELNVCMERMNVTSSRMISAWLGGCTLNAVQRADTPPPPPPIGGWRADLTLLALKRVPRAAVHKALPNENAACGSKLRGTSRRIIGKQGRREARERARRAVPAALTDAREAAARRGRESIKDTALARMLGEGLSMTREA